MTPVQPTGTTDTAGTADSPDTAAEPRWQRVCSVAELPDGTALGAEIDGEPVCVVRSGGHVYALRDVCSHAEVKLSEGEVEDRLVECWLHGSQFDLATGEPISLPATEPVPTYAVTIDGDDVLVDVHTNLK